MKGKLLTRENKKLSPSCVDLGTCDHAGADVGKAAKEKESGRAATAETPLGDFSEESHEKTMHLVHAFASASVTSASSGPTAIKMNTHIHWIPPPKQWIKLNIAAYVNRNEGVGCAAGIIRNEFGRWVFGYAVGVGTRSFSAPELLAVSHGLRDAWERGFRRIVVEVESRLALELLRNPSVARISDRSLVDCCLHLMHRRWDCRADLIFREANVCAYQLAARFCDRELEMTSFHYPPSGLPPFLQNDLVRSGLSSASPF